MTEVQELARLIKEVQWRHHRLLDSRLRAEAEITIVQWDALRAMVYEPGASARRLAGETFQSEQSFGVMAAGMERRGLITRTPGSGRTREHRVTAEGRRLLELGSAFADDAFAQTIGRLGAGDRDELGALLRRMLGERSSPGGREEDKPTKDAARLRTP